MINGLTTIALTKLDVLTGFKKIKVAVGYERKGKKIDFFPSSALDEVVPVYEELDGWSEDLSGVTGYEDLPGAAKSYIRFIEKGMGVKISVVSVGAGRENTFLKN